MALAVVVVHGVAVVAGIQGRQILVRMLLDCRLAAVVAQETVSNLDRIDIRRLHHNLWRIFDNFDVRPVHLPLPLMLPQQRYLRLEASAGDLVAAVVVVDRTGRRR
jgi:hypothetical protein